MAGDGRLMEWDCDEAQRGSTRMEWVQVGMV
jgi:hypothetical protein